MKQIIFAICLLIAGNTSAQILHCNNECTDVSQKYVDQYDCLDESNPPSLEVVEMVDRLKKVMDWEDLTVQIIECDNHRNCTATTDMKGIKTIIYDPLYLKVGLPSFNVIATSQLKETENWRALAILGHELAHLFKGDLKSSNKLLKSERISIELEADFMAGKMLALLGATENQIKEVSSTFSIEACGNHPDQISRNRHLLLGWDRIKASLKKKEIPIKSDLLSEAFKKGQKGITNFEKGYWYLKNSKYKIAENFFLAAFEEDNISLAAYYLCRIYYQLKEKDKVVFFANEAIDKGFHLASYFLESQDITDDKLLLLSMLNFAEKEDCESQNNLGALYYRGEIVNQDLQLAKEWFEIAAEQGYAPAQNNLGMVYEEDGAYLEAFHWYQEAASQGHTIAQTSLGVLLEKGIGVDKNIKSAKQWYQKAAIKGYARAQTNLGELYYQSQSYDKALKWFSLAAESGYPRAQNNLGLFFKNGTGDILVDLDLALKWFSLAAKQGYRKAEVNLEEVLNLLYSNNTVSPAKKSADPYIYEHSSEEFIETLKELGVGTLVKIESSEPLVRVLPLEYEEVIQKVLVKDSHTDYKLIPATFETVTQQVLTKEGYSIPKGIEPIFETQTEAILIAESYDNVIVKPAQFQTITIPFKASMNSEYWTLTDINCNGEIYENILEKTAYPAMLNSYKYEQLIEPASYTVEEVPAKYATITKQVCTNCSSEDYSPELTEFMTITMRILKEPAKLIENQVEDEFMEISTKTIKHNNLLETPHSIIPFQLIECN